MIQVSLSSPLIWPMPTPKQPRAFRFEGGAEDQGNPIAVFDVYGGHKEALGSFFNDGKIMFFGNYVDDLLCGHLFKQANWHNSFGVLGDGCLKKVGINNKRIAFNINKHRCSV